MAMIWLRNATLVDGTGKAPVPGDLLIRRDRISAVGRFGPPSDAREIDCSSLTISPGFLDIHTHSDLQVLERRREKIQQGVTAEVVGNCGFSTFPAPKNRKLLYEFANGILCGNEQWGWNSAQEYLALARKKAVVEVGTLVGHGSLRVAQAGHLQGPLPEREIDAMASRLSDSLEGGACGLSSGLMYAPGSSVPMTELERLCRIIARYDGVYAVHLRDYGSQLPEAVEEQIELARRTECRLQISHLQAVGSKNWDKQQKALQKIEKARAEGLDVAFDCYPYIAGSTVLTQFLPQWALVEGGVEKMLARFSDKNKRSSIIQEMESSLAQEWGDLIVSAVQTEPNQALVGKDLVAIALKRRCEPSELVLDLITEEHGNVNILEFNQSEPNLRALVRHPLGLIVSDGFYVRGRPHPRLYGAFPYLLGEICRNRHWLSLQEAINKITDAPALRFGFRERGRLEPGFFADLVVFDAKTINGPATYENPELEPMGIRFVFKDGKPAVGSLNGGLG